MKSRVLTPHDQWRIWVKLCEAMASVLVDCDVKKELKRYQIVNLSRWATLNQTVPMPSGDIVDRIQLERIVGSIVELKTDFGWVTKVRWIHNRIGIRIETGGNSISHEIDLLRLKNHFPEQILELRFEKCPRHTPIRLAHIGVTDGYIIESGEKTTEICTYCYHQVLSKNPFTRMLDRIRGKHK